MKFGKKLFHQHLHPLLDKGMVIVVVIIIRQGLLMKSIQEMQVMNETIGRMTTVTNTGIGLEAVLSMQTLTRMTETMTGTMTGTEGKKLKTRKTLLFMIRHLFPHYPPLPSHLMGLLMSESYPELSILRIILLLCHLNRLHHLPQLHPLGVNIIIIHLQSQHLFLWNLQLQSQELQL